MNPQLRRMALDLGPLLIFFAAFKWGGFFVATAAFKDGQCAGEGGDIQGVGARPPR